MAETSFIYRIGIHATAQTALPSVPYKGSNFASTTGYIIIGSIQAGDDADLDSGTVAYTFFNEIGQVHPPKSLTREKILNFRSGIDTVTFTAYDGSETLLAKASTLTPTLNKTEAVAAQTKRTVFVEVNGLWADYFPNCVVLATTANQGYTDDVSKTDFTIYPCAHTGGSTIKGGWQRHHYQVAP